MKEAAKNSACAHILVVEDSSVFREMQTLLLGQAGFVVSAHENPHAALAAAAKRKFELVLIDYELPDMNGQDFMHALRKIQPDIAVVFVSGSLTLELAVQLSSQGVAGIFNKPANPKILLEKITETLASNAVRDTAARTGSASSPSSPKKRGSSDSPFSTSSAPSLDKLAYTPRFVPGTSEAFRKFTHRLWKVRDFRSVLLLQGEVGSPFESLARELAEISIFRDGPLMVCPAAEFESRRLLEILAPTLLSHDAGTLIVTGVETLTAGQQATLHNLTTGRDVFLPFARRFRLLLAATTELTDRVDDGAFDDTLFYKISSLSLSVPSLREMRGDIVTNAVRILAQLGNSESIATTTGFTPDAAEWLEAQDWPGNFEELTRTLQQAIGYASGPTLTVAALEAGSGRAGNLDSPGEPLLVPAEIAVIHPEAVSQTRPPFPLASDLARDAVKEHATNGSHETGRTMSDAQSLFRPTSTSYSFTQRLAETLSAAEACGAS